MQSMLYRYPSDSSTPSDVPEFPLREIADLASQAASGAWGMLVEFNAHVEGFARQNPGPALAVAILFGFLASRVLRRRRRVA